MKYCIVPLIPTYEPDEKLINYVEELIENGFEKILIVNDGSSEKCNQYFEKLGKRKECIIIKHEKNRGKGQALKTGFKYYKDNLIKDYEGIVTADSDGQHSVKDTINIAIDIQKYKNTKILVLGVRNFNKEGIPFASNKLAQECLKS